MEKTFQKIRFLVGKTISRFCDICVHPKSPLCNARLPVGLHLQRDLRVFLGPSVTNILDVGAHHGMTVAAFARHFPNAKIHAFEPIRENFSRLVSSCSGNARIVCNHCACGKEHGDANIEISKDSERNSLKTQVMPSGAFETIQVIRIDHYVQAKSIPVIDLLKIDTEGFEIEVLDGAGELMTSGKVRAVFAECGFIGTDLDKTHFSILDSYLTQRGFIFSGFYDNFRWGPNKRWLGFSNGLWLFNSSKGTAC